MNTLSLIIWFLATFAAGYAVGLADAYFMAKKALRNVETKIVREASEKLKAEFNR